MNPTPIENVLLVEDSRGDARLLREMFREQHSEKVALTHVTRMADAEQHLKDHGVDVILLDLGLPDAQGVEAIQRVRAAAPRVPLVVLTGFDDQPLALRALNEGAQDYLVKGQLEARGLMRALRYAVERKRMEETLFAEKELALVTLSSIGEAVLCTDVEGSITFLNAMAETMTGWPRDEAMGRPLADVLKILGTTTRKTMPIPTVIAADRSRTVTLPPSFILVRRDGFEMPIEDSVAPIRDRHGVLTGAVVVFRDVSAAHAMAAQMTHSAEHDYLTNLPNRMLLKLRVEQAITRARRYATRLAVLYLDLDGFKHINDSLGHPVGDKLLQSVARRLLECARSSDTVSRQGGDEFVVLLSEVKEPEDAVLAASRMLKAVAGPHSIDDHDLHVTTSIGISIFPDDGADAQTLIQNADTAMYQAKENGRQGYQYFKPEMNARAVERQSIEESLRRALQRDELSLHYQPKINFKTGAITGAEALLRWNHPTRGMVSPATFIPVAEDCGLVVPIGKWVLRQACMQAQNWVDAGLPPTSIAVNVSARQLRDDGFVESLFAILDQTGLDPRLLELELTESVLMTHAESAAAILQTLRRQGIRVAVDDFGTGYSSLSYLRRFQIDALKIDQSFVGEITTADSDTSIVTAVISMARSLKLRVVAEGVETLAQSTFLRTHHCDEAQGYYFSRPVPSDCFVRLLVHGIVPPVLAPPLSTAA